MNGNNDKIYITTTNHLCLLENHVTYDFMQLKVCNLVA